MDVTKTVKVKITTHNKIFNSTLNIYREALGYILNVVDLEWDKLESLTSKEKLTQTEKLIHKTKKNPTPKYDDFDELFIKFPSYFRRSAINEAAGIVKSFKSNYENWELKEAEFENEGKALKNNPPKLSLKHFTFPVFYKDAMFKRLNDNQAMIKVYYKNDWIWITASFDKKSLTNRDLCTYKECNPTLVKKGKKYEFHIPFTKNVELKNTKLKEKIIIAVDLGINTSAVCSAIKYDGTVIGREFINQPIEKDRLSKKLNYRKKAQKNSCMNSKNKLPNHYRRIDNLQNQIVNDTVDKIVKFAKKHNADVIVFEYLGKFNKNVYGNLREQMQFWAKYKIQNKTKEKAHRLGIRFSRINPKNTSALAFDGSGKVIRDNKNAKLCTFSTGKQYNADLNASYNIGARYYIREIQKPISEKKWLGLQAKVPDISKRTSCTLASLISLIKAMQEPSSCPA